MQIFEGRKAILLDMNGTFMFGEDRFGPAENFFEYYQNLGGSLTEGFVNLAIEKVYAYLEECYQKPEYLENFPSVVGALQANLPTLTDLGEIDLLVETFAAHEIGEVDSDHVAALKKLAKKYKLGAVIDIWSPKAKWETLFAETGLRQLFSAVSYSSDSGIVKPSPRPFARVLTEIGVSPEEALFVGDSVRRDLGGAIAAGLGCVLVGGDQDGRAFACARTFLELVN